MFQLVVETWDLNRHPGSCSLVREAVISSASLAFRLDPGGHQGGTETFSSELLQEVFQVFMLDVMELKVERATPLYCAFITGVFTGAPGAQGEVLQCFHPGSGNADVSRHCLHRRAGREVTPLSSSSSLPRTKRMVQRSSRARLWERPGSKRGRGLLQGGLKVGGGASYRVL